MVDFIGAARDPQFRQDVGQGLVDAFGRGLSMVGGAPVDLTTMFLRPLGYSVPDEQIVGSSEYIGRQMANLGLISETRNPAAEFLSALLIPDPTDIQKLAPVIERGIARAAQNISAPRTLNRQAGQIGASPPRPQAPREEALRIAQENAAKPVSEGGLGLPPDNTAMDRARAMGFDTPAYRGTTADETNLKPRTFVSENPDVANQYAGYLKDFADDPVMLDAMMKLTPSGNVMPLLVRDADVARSRTNIPDYEMIVDANQSRSRFAAFDPAKRYDPDLLGAADPRLLMLLGLGSGAGLYGLGELYRQKQDNR